MSSELARTDRGLVFTEEQRRILLDTFANGATEAEFSALVEVAQKRNLDPFKREIFFVKRWDASKGREVWATQVSIDGLRLMAERSGLYDGQDEPVFEYGSNPAIPLLCRVRVYRKDWTRPAVGVARWEEYVQTTRDKQSGQTRPNTMWAKMGHTMLAKCAEALAIRKAFPESAAGLHTDDEMGQAQNSAPTQHVEVQIEHPQLPSGPSALARFTDALHDCTDLASVIVAWHAESAALSREASANDADAAVARWLDVRGHRMVGTERQKLLAKNYPIEMLALLDALADQGSASRVVAWCMDADIAQAIGALPDHHAGTVKLIAARTWCAHADVKTTTPGKVFAKAIENARATMPATPVDVVNEPARPVSDDPEREAIQNETASQVEKVLPPALEGFYARVTEIELPGEAVAVWMKHRTDLASLPVADREDAWKALYKRTEEVGKMKNAKVWLKKSIAEEDVRRASEPGAKAENAA